MITDAPPPPDDEASAKPRRIRPAKALPTPRIAFQKQLNILRAYAVEYEATGKPVGNMRIAQLLDMAFTTVPHANPFFAESGLLQRGEGGYMPAPEVVSFSRAHGWNPDNAGKKLAPVLRPTWFANALIPTLMFRNAIDESEAIAILADASGASPEYKPALEMLLDYLETAGLLIREGTLVRKTVAGLPDTPEPDPLLPPSAPAAQALPSAAIAEPPQAVARTTEQHLLDILDPDVMTDEEQNAIWTLLKYLKKKAR